MTTTLSTPRRAASRTGALGRRNSLRWAGLLVAVGILLVVLVASIAIGSRNVPPHTVFRALFHYSGGYDQIVVRELRLPRTLVGLAVGAALGLAGAVMQALTRNPLADPGLLGVNSGAAAAAVTAVGLLGVTNPAAYVWVALLGAAVAFALVDILGSRGRAAA